MDSLPKSPLSEAISCARNQWAALMRFLSKHGDRRAAILYTLIRTFKRHGFNPWDYPRDYLYPNLDPPGQPHRRTAAAPLDGKLRRSQFERSIRHAGCRTPSAPVKTGKSVNE